MHPNNTDVESPYRKRQTLKKNKPLAPGLEFLKRCLGKYYVTGAVGQFLAFLLTFLAYMTYHAARKPPSIVKTVLHGDDFEGGNPGWEPFNGPNGKERLGLIDVAFLAAYALGMFSLGHLGDRYELRRWLSIGLLMSGIFVIFVGMGYFWDEHSLSYYTTTQILAGLCQSTGWPSVVAIMANWYGHGHRGFIMGIWNSHTSVGNILGSVVAAEMLKYGWGWAYVVPGFFLILMAILVYLFLVVQPSDLPEINEGENQSLMSGSSPNFKELQQSSQNSHEVGMFQALAIPGVTSFALCLFFAKLIAYTFLYWLPFYIGATPIGGQQMSPEDAGRLSVLFDIGGVVGGVVAGSLSDKYQTSALVAFTFLFASFPCMYIYSTKGDINMGMNLCLLALCGFCVNGPYALITTAVSADLGSHESLAGNERALATVTAIIDGMGSVGAAIGPLLTGYVSEMKGGFSNVFTMLYLSAFAAGLLLTKLVWKDIKYLLRQTYQTRGNVQE